MAELTGEALGAATVAPVKAVKGGAMAAATAQQQAQEPEQVRKYLADLLCLFLCSLSDLCCPIVVVMYFEVY